MMKNLALIAITLTVLVVFLSPLSVTGEEKTNYFIIRGGIYSPKSDDLEDFDTGSAVEIAFGHYFNRNFALELGLGYLDTDAECSGFDPILLGNFKEDDEITIMPLTLTAKGEYPLGDNLKLYGLVGGGLYFADAESNISSSFLGNLSPDDSATSLGVHVGLGFNYSITPRLSLGVEGRHFLADAKLNYSAAHIDADLDGYIVTAGVTFLFGGDKKKELPPPEVVSTPKDSDRDGVLDDLDKCPGTPSGVKVDRSGCPLDSDGDGVYDDIDECPGTPAGVRVDRSGCPLDNDGDGIYNDLDECPDTPKGVKVDPKGCPMDSDRDGVIDTLDRCPRTPKGATVNEYGCWVCKDVHFDFDKSNIKPEYYPNLDMQADFLKRNPDIAVEIQGHTDNIGHEGYNQRLSEKRANAVMNYLIEKGIPKERLSAKGYGFSVPMASNETKEGRARNRRVQFSVCDDEMQ
jgi:opacity protein-like surface antigen